MKSFFRGLIYSAFSCLAVSSLSAVENDPVLMKINGKEVLASEFSYIYGKYHTNSQKEKTSVRDYVPMYVNFRLKIEEALSDGLDTTKAFNKELSGYRGQLSRQYLDPARYAESLLRSIYDQSGEVVEASHIFVKTPAKSLPADTLVAYERIMQIYERLKKGESFDKVALDASEDVGSDTERPGYLGWIYPMIVIQPITDAAYATPVGAFSYPVRSTFGYHIIKVHGKKANPGEVLAAHILISAQENNLLQAKHRIDSIYSVLQSGGDFSVLAKEFSDDRGSAAKGGELPWFGVRKMVPEFETIAFSLVSPGEYSRPFRTRFGYHIIKLLGKRPFPSYEDMKEDIARQLPRSDRAWEFRGPQLNELKAAYGFRLYPDAYREIIRVSDIYYPKDSMFIENASTLDKPLFEIGEDIYTQKDFVTYIKKQLPSNYSFSTDVIEDKMNAYVYGLLLKKEEQNLEARFPEFRNLMTEYHDGMLLFEISNKEVWNKAGKDTTGLERFFKKHASDYKWRDKRYKGVIVLCKDEAIRKRLDGYSKTLSTENVDDIIKTHFNADSIPEVKVIKGIYVKGDNPLVDQICFDKKRRDISLPDGYTCYFEKGKRISSPESYKDIKGIVISDYQEELEKEWVQSLNRKFPTEIYWDVIDRNIQN
ncbi:MAG: peptidylprolyl isomerase [Bacteroidales bacterium]|nr:peptidylprolyl isomerase [Bacteroidales bacterium]